MACYWRSQSIIGLRQAGEPKAPRGLGDVCEILCCFFFGARVQHGEQMDLQSQTPAELDIALHLFTICYLTEADLMSFR